MPACFFELAALFECELLLVVPRFRGTGSEAHTLMIDGAAPGLYGCAGQGEE
jgi:hypothetical protein